MSLLPQETIVYTSPLSIQQLHERLQTYVEPRLTGFIDWKQKRQKPYEGIVDTNGFEINRIIDYRNSFLPVISGKLTAAENQTIITITMSLHSFVRIFITIWCSMAILFLIAYSTKSIQERMFDTVTLVPLTMLIFVYSLTITSFKKEIKKTKEDLQEMLSATIK